MNIRVKQDNIMQEKLVTSFQDVINSFCSQYPKDAISWMDATQEIAILAKVISEYVNVSLPTTLTSTPAEYNTKFVTFIETNSVLLKGEQVNELLVRFDNWFNKPLFESENTEDKELKALTASKTKKFTLDNGLYFETINSGKIDNKISLNWHVKNTFNVDEFIESVRLVVNVTDQDLTENDIARLLSHYEKYSSK